jgi:hypothetical protein
MYYYSSLSVIDEGDVILDGETEEIPQEPALILPEGFNELSQ